MILVKDSSLFCNNYNSISYRIKYKIILADLVKKIQIKLEVLGLQLLVRQITRTLYNFKVWVIKK